MTSEDEARRRLAARIMTIEYHQRDVAWLKVVPVAGVAEGVEDGQLASALRSAGADPGKVEDARQRLVQVFLEDHFNCWTPEDSPYSLFLEGTWRRVERRRMERELDRIFTATDKELRRNAAKLVTERAEAEAGGYPTEKPDDGSSPPFEDYATLRRWFTADLWPGPGVSWFVFEPPARGTKVPAVIAVDDLLIGVLWVQW